MSIINLAIFIWIVGVLYTAGRTKFICKDTFKLPSDVRHDLIGAPSLFKIVLGCGSLVFALIVMLLILLVGWPYLLGMVTADDTDRILESIRQMAKPETD